MKNHDVVVAVTGGNRGIGYEICQQLGRRGARVVLTARNAKAGQIALEKFGANSKNVLFQPLDVTSTKSIHALRDFIEKTFTRLDVLINNAGILPDDDTSGLKVDLATVRTTLETNSLAPLHLCQILAPLLKRSRAGRIVNMSSGMGALSEMAADHAAYRISKAALNAVTGILSAEMQGVGIAVNSMCPGWVRTEMGGRMRYGVWHRALTLRSGLLSTRRKTLRGSFCATAKSFPGEVVFVLLALACFAVRE